MEASLPAEREVEEIESLCMNCHADGTTRLLLTRIPYFKEIVIMSFSCPECNFKNSEIQSAGEIQQKGVNYKFRLDSALDLQRQVVKSDTCVFRIEDIDLEIPAGRGQLSNVEGLVSMVQQDLTQKQADRQQLDPELHSKVEGVIQSLVAMLQGLKFPFTVSLDDPTGNSTIEPAPADRSGKYVRTEYPRTPSQNALLGIGAPTEELVVSEDSNSAVVDMRPEYRAAIGPDAGVRPSLNVDDADDIVENQVYAFPSHCPGCMAACATNMKMVRIPHFKEVVLMSTVCDACGYRSNEVKTGGEVPALGRRITLRVVTREDLSRDILKAESCALACPELDLTVEPGTLGGRFTTVEGLLTQVRDDLRSSVFDMGSEQERVSDSMEGGTRARWAAFFASLDAAITGPEKPFTLVLQDPLAGSYVQSLTAPEPDPKITIEDYERTEEEEEELGLRDIKTEGYEVEGANEATAGEEENTPSAAIHDGTS